MDEQARSEELTRALTGLGGYMVIAAVETTEGQLVVEVMAATAEAPCPACGTFPARVKSYRTCTVVDSPPLWAALPAAGDQAGVSLCDAGL